MSKVLRIAPLAVAAALAAAGLTACTSGPASRSDRDSPAALTAAKSKTGTYPVTIDAANGHIRIASRPTAIMSLSPTATEMLYAIGAGSQVKAVDEYSDYPPGAPRTDLDELDPNIEAIVSYHPDLVVLGPGDTSALNRQIGEFGIPVLYEPAAATLAGAYSQFVQLGQATGHVASAREEVAHIKSRIAAIVKSTPRPAPPATYYYELDQTYYSATSSTFIGRLLGLLGLKNIADAAKGASSSGGYPQLSAEFIIKANPEYIFLADTICCAQSPETVAARPGWSTLSAVREGHVVGLNDDIASRWGPRIVNLLQTVSDALKSGGRPAS